MHLHMSGCTVLSQQVDQQASKYKTTSMLMSQQAHHAFTHVCTTSSSSINDISVLVISVYTTYTCLQHNQSDNLEHKTATMLMRQQAHYAFTHVCTTSSSNINDISVFVISVQYTTYTCLQQNPGNIENTTATMLMRKQLAATRMSATQPTR